MKADGLLVNVSIAFNVSTGNAPSRLNLRPITPITLFWVRRRVLLGRAIRLCVGEGTGAQAVV